MKKIYFAAAIIAIAIGTANFLGTDNRTESEKALDENAEALASGEDADCHYTNGYTSFGNDSGGAYDCCMKWHNMQPNGPMCH